MAEKQKQKSLFKLWSSGHGHVSAQDLLTTLLPQIGGGGAAASHFGCLSQMDYQEETNSCAFK